MKELDEPMSALEFGIFTAISAETKLVHIPLVDAKAIYEYLRSELLKKEANSDDDH